MPNGNALPPNLQDRLVLTTLGRASLECVTESGERHELLGPGKPLGLLVYLACSPGRSASREHLVDLLWADLHVEAAKHSVRQAIWFLRQRLGEAAIANRDGAVTLCAPIESDRDAFLEAIERVEFERAVDLYRGDFLPGFAAPGGADFEQWADVERFRLHRQFRRAGETVVRDWMAKGRLRKAKDLAARLRDVDPDDESTWRLVLESLLAANDRVGAEFEAHRLDETLAQAERPPEPATTALLALVRQAPPESPAAPSKQTLTAELIGREREFAAILTAWDSSRHSSGRHVHVSGQAGLGKSRLLADVHARLRAGGARVVLVRANPGERNVPYTLASELAAHLAALPGAAAVSPASAGALVALNPSLSARYSVPADRATELEALRRRETALLELLVAVADEQPVALLIDDMHWSDSSSRQLVEGLVAKLAGRRALMVTCARSGPEGEIASPATDRIALRPLSAQDTGALLASLGRMPPDPWADGLPVALHTATRGTPLLILETLHLLIERGTLTLADGVWACADPSLLSAELARGGALGRRTEELERGPRWLLLLLAAAGTPLDAELVARAAGRDREAVDADLLALEMRGLATRAGAEYQPAHDEIAALALELASADALRAANAALGRLLAAAGRHDPGALHRAGRHLALAGEEVELGRVFTRCLLLQRRRGERRSPLVLAADLLGQEATPPRVKRLVRTLPLHIRLGLTSPTRIVAAILGGLLLASGTSFPLWRPAPPPPDVTLVVLPPQGEDSITALAAPLRRTGWERAGPIRPQPYPILAAAGGRNDHVASPDGGSWAFSRLVADSGEIELFVVGPDGQPRRVTHARGDDGGPSWSPDGRSIAFATDRWNVAIRRTDLAVLDLSSGRVRRLTNGGASASEIWSPDGTRIAYTTWSDSAGMRLCWTTPDGESETCTHVTFGSATIIGWYDDQQVVLSIDSANAQVLERVNLDTKRVTIIVKDTIRVTASPDGRWATCFCLRPGFSEPRWLVYPTDAPELARPLWIDSPGSGVVVGWVLSADRAAYLDTLEITAPSDTIPLSAPFQFRARGFDATGNPIALHALHWRTDTNTVATIERSSGVLHPHREGAVTIVASAGGWRETRRRFVVRALTPSPVLRETWNDSIAAHWVPFGDPLPSIVPGPGGRLGFWNHGDGHFLSGAYSQQEFQANRGLAIDAELSTPVVGPRQQMVYITPVAFEDLRAIERWDHHTGNPPGLLELCTFGYPQGGGDHPGDRVIYTFGARSYHAPHWMPSGAWYAVRIQLFPDGRCGLAINGKPVSITNDALAADRRYRLLLWGNSLGNRMLVGPVTIWEGVPGDVDWSAVDNRP